jgi:hypothetical protein
VLDISFSKCESIFLRVTIFTNPFSSHHAICRGKIIQGSGCHGELVTPGILSCELVAPGPKNKPEFFATSARPGKSSVFQELNRILASSDRRTGPWLSGSAAANFKKKMSRSRF